jgi:dihydrofolate synthase / folylpolyglutamate synthase
MHYDDAIKFVYGLELFGIKMGLDNITRFLDHLGNPQNSFQSIHVAGTNGKGSVCSMLFSILKAHGYNAGVFTSPHLVDYRERVRTAQGAIDKKSVAEFVGKHRQFIVDARITFFEISTALAFWYFRKMGVDVAVVEVGLGGRLDATNILKPRLSVITHIDFDHTKILGSTLEKIAVEKAGIIKSGVPLVTGERRPELYEMFREVCKERHTTITRPAQPRKRYSFSNGLMRFDVSCMPEGSGLSSSLVGVHQIDNAAIAVKCAEVLNRQGIKISDRAVKMGLRRTRWPARFQLVSKQPEIVLDVAHNPDGARALVSTFKTVYGNRKVILVCGFLERPDFDIMMQEFAAITRRAVITRPQAHRAAEIEGVIWGATNAGLDFDVKLVVADAVDRALKLAAKGEMVLICGSHYTVGEAITRLKQLHSRKRLNLLSADITYIDG